METHRGRLPVRIRAGVRIARIDGVPDGGRSLVPVFASAGLLDARFDCAAGGVGPALYRSVSFDCAIEGR